MCYHGITFGGSGHISEAVAIVANRRPSFHGLKLKLNSRKWDQVEVELEEMWLKLELKLRTCGSSWS